MATRLNMDGTKENVSYWHVPGDKGKYKSWWAGVTRLSKEFADTYTGGRDMAVGFGGYYSICGSASRGPAIGAIAKPGGTTGSTLDLVPMMTYADPAASIRNGRYLPVVGYWDEPFPASPWEGWWTYNDICHAGVFIDLPDKKGYLAFVELVVGRIGYDYGGYNTDGHEEDGWYFYSLDDLGQAALGNIVPDSIKPKSMATVTYPLGGGPVQGACFDEEERMMYLYTQWSLDNGRPIVHAYRIKEATSINDGNIATGSEQDFGLEVWPNPFNTSVDIRLNSSTVPQFRSSAVKPEVIIFDINGKLVSRPDNCGTVELQHCGTSYRWYAQDHPAGIYFIHVKAGDHELKRKIILVK
jgi:hypothetical protein